MTEVYLTIDDAAKRAKVSRNTIKAWMKMGLPVIVFNSRMKRFHAGAFDEWVCSKMQGTITDHWGRELAVTENYLIEKTRVGR